MQNSVRTVTKTVKNRNAIARSVNRINQNEHIIAVDASVVFSRWITIAPGLTIVWAGAITSILCYFLRLNDDLETTPFSLAVTCGFFTTTIR